MSWFQSGWGNKEMQERSGAKPLRRFWVRPGERSRVVFLDDKPFILWEHQVRFRDERLELTCLSNAADRPETFEKPCPLCDAGDDPVQMAFLTIADFWTDDKGKARLTKKIFPMKGRVYKMMTELVKKRQGKIRGWVVECFRPDEKSSAVGSSFDFEEQIEVSTLAPLLDWLKDPKFNPKKFSVEQYLSGYDYETLMAPKEPAELVRVARRIAGVGGDYSAASAADGTPAQGDAPPSETSEDDTIPF